MTGEGKQCVDARARVEYNPFLPEFRRNPYPCYHRIREQEPVHRFKTFRGHQWLLTRYNDVRRLLAGKSFLVDDLPIQVSHKSCFSKQKSHTPYANLIACIRYWLFFNDPAEHTKLRSVFGKRFNAGEIEYLRKDIYCHVNGLVSSLLKKGEMDIISDVASKLPSITMASILGLSDDNLSNVAQWSTDLFRILVPPQSIESLDAMDVIASKFVDYFQPLISERERNPGKDLLSQIVLAKQNGVLTSEQTLALSIMLYSVGQETTENLIGNGMLALLQNPEQWRLLCRQRELLSDAVDEVARYDTPVQGVARIASENVCIDDVLIEKGDRIVFALAAALRDPQQFSNPDVLDITRENNSKLPFGGGIHFCLGAYLAKLQAEVVFDVLADRCQNLQLVSNEPEWRSSTLLRGVHSLPVKFTPSRSFGVPGDGLKNGVSESV